MESMYKKINNICLLINRYDIVDDLKKKYKSALKIVYNLKTVNN